MVGPDTSARQGRSARPEQIADHLRSRIVDGVYKPGTRLPPRARLSGELGASTGTLQRALDRLSREGFVRVRPRGGTYVAVEPPHRNHYGLAFTAPPTHHAVWEGARFWTVLHRQASLMQKAAGRAGAGFSIYTGVDERVGGEEYRRLRADVLARRLAGVILTVPFHLMDLARHSPIPCVGMYDRDNLPGILPVCLDQRQWLDRALEYLAGRGRRRVAAVMPSSGPPERREEVLAAIEARGMAASPWWVQGVDVQSPHWARPCVRMLLGAPPGQRPDGLLILDDTLADHAIAAAVEAGVTDPGELDVVAHCNFPWGGTDLLPVKRLGWDARQVLQTCMDVIDRAAAGEPVEGITRVPLHFEDELLAEAAAR